VGVIEVPKGEWNDLIPNLVDNANSQDFNVKMASLMTLGYLCEDIEPCYIEED
jgi:importin subunit beta-1